MYEVRGSDALAAPFLLVGEHQAEREENEKEAGIGAGGGVG